MLQSSVPDPPRYDLIRRGTVPRRISIAAVPHRGGFRSPWYGTAADFCQISKRRSPRYRTAADFYRRGTVSRWISIAAVPYRGDQIMCCETFFKQKKVFLT